MSAGGGPLERRRERLVEALRRRLAEERRSDDGSAGLAVAEHAAALVERDLAVLPAAEREELRAALVRRTVGLGPLEPLIADPEVGEVMVVAPDRVYVERAGVIQPAGVGFSGESELREVIDRALAPSGRRVDERSPMADARLPDGSRVNVVIPPLAIDGPQLCIRRFVAAYADLRGLVAAGSIDPEQLDLLEAAVRERESILISGGTSTGKTTLLATLLDLLPRSERVVLVEDSAEIPTARPHLVRLQARPAGLGGGGEVPIRALLRNALRMRPDRLIVGEVRGEEAFDLMVALNTGHRGSLATIHANSPQDALRRMRSLVLMARTGLEPAAIDEQIRAAIDLVVHLERSGGRRAVAAIARVGSGGAEVIA